MNASTNCMMVAVLPGQRGNLLQAALHAVIAHPSIPRLAYSTSVRAAMLAAGYYVAKGSRSGLKAETAIGFSLRAASGPHLALPATEMHGAGDGSGQAIRRG
jgi:hypothetical protein